MYVDLLIPANNSLVNALRAASMRSACRSAGIVRAYCALVMLKLATSKCRTPLVTGTPACLTCPLNNTPCTERTNERQLKIFSQSSEAAHNSSRVFQNELAQYNSA